MAFLSKQQVTDIVKRRPAGTTPEEIVSELRKQGHNIEGFVETRVISEKVLGPATFTDRAKRGAAEGWQKGVESFKGSVEAYDKGDIGLPRLGAELLSAGTQSLAGAGTGAIKESIYKPYVAPVIEPSAKAIGTTALKYTPQSVKTAAGKIATNAVSQWEKLSPEQQRTLGLVGKTVDAVGTIGAGKIATEGALELGTTLTKEAIKVTKPIISKGVTAAKEKIGTHFEKAAMNFAKKESGLSGTALIKAEDATKKAGYEGVSDYMLQNKFPLGKPEEMVTHADTLFKEATKEAKPEILSKIKIGFSTKENHELIDAINSTFKGGSPESRAIKAELEALRKKPYLTAQEQERIRALGDQNLKLKYSPEGESGTVFDNQNLMDAARKRLSDADPTGVLVKKNAEIQALYQMKNNLAKNLAKSPGREFYLPKGVRMLIGTQILANPGAAATAKGAEILIEKVAKELNATNIYKWAKGMKGQELSLVKRLQQEAITGAKDMRILDAAHQLPAPKYSTKTMEGVQNFTKNQPFPSPSKMKVTTGEPLMSGLSAKPGEVIPLPAPPKIRPTPLPKGTTSLRRPVPKSIIDLSGLKRIGKK